MNSFPETTAALRRLKVEIKLFLAAWLVGKALRMTPDSDIRTHLAFHVLLKTMIAEDAGRNRCRVWEET